MSAQADSDVAGPTRGAERFEGVERWSAHPQLARITRLVAYGVPLVLAVTSGWLLGRQGFTQNWSPFIRWVVMSAFATGVLVLVERVARRLLPLGALLDLSLVFPDRAPSRFAVALRAGSVSQLESRLVPTADDTIATDSADAAARILAHVFALHTHDRRTRGHSERVRAFAVLIGREIGLQPRELDKLQWAALLHDVGKLKVPSSILNKDGRPTKEEWATLASHPEHGEQLIAPLADWLGDWAGAITEHHERWDGEGYPRGLRAEDISLAGRIVAVADSFEVMTAARSYKKPLSIAAARTELTRCAGAQFDPAIVRAFLNVSIGRVRRVLGPVAWAGQLPFIPAAAALPAPGAMAATTALVGGLLLGPTVMPFVGGEGTADAAMATTSTLSAPSGVASRPILPTVSGGTTSSIGSPLPACATPTTTAVPTAPAPAPTPVNNPGPVAEVPAVPGLDPVVAPVVNGVVAPIVGSLITPVDSVVTPLVGSVVAPVQGLVDSDVNPLVGSLLQPLLPPGH